MACTAILGARPFGYPPPDSEHLKGNGRFSRRIGQGAGSTVHCRMPVPPHRLQRERP